MDLSTIEKVLDFAIGQEEKAAKLYTLLAEGTDSESMKDVFLQFAKEEKGHRAKLIAIREGKQVMIPANTPVPDLKIGDYLEDVNYFEKLDYQQALILAMKAEKAAFRLYQDLASATDDQVLKETLLGLAQEEAKHKLRFEIEYDDNVLKEN